MVKKRKPAVADELLDELLGSTDALGAFQSGDLIQDLIQDLKKALAERILNAGLEHHLDDEEQASGNHRNGHSSKRIITDDDTLDLSIPHDRQDQFEPKLIEKHSRR
jgi:putative transposase